MSTLKQTLQSDMKSALRGGDKSRLAVIRMLLAAIQRREVDERVELDDAGVLKTIEKLVKQGQDSARQYTEGGRQELADKELAEIEVLRAYLPEQLGDAELDALIDSVISATGAETVRDMGKVMGAMREQTQGRADMGAVGARVKEKLSN